MPKVVFKVDPDVESRVPAGDGSTEPVFTEPPDPDAPEAATLADLIDSDLLEPVRCWLKRARIWVYMRPMDTEEKREWLKKAIVTINGKQEVAPDYMEDAISRSLCDKRGTLTAAGDEGKAQLRRRHPDTFAELWEHAAQVNVLREKDNDALKNSSAGGLGSATSPSSPAPTAPPLSLAT